MEGDIIMNNDLKRSIILDNYQFPSNRKIPNDDSYIKINTNNESCIDNIDLYVKVENDIIKDINFEGEACAISISTTSIMTKLLIGKSIKEALNIIRNYQNMIEEKDYDANILKEAIVYNETYKQPSRIKCATLTWNGMEKLLKDKFLN